MKRFLGSMCFGFTIGTLMETFFYPITTPIVIWTLAGSFMGTSFAWVFSFLGVQLLV